MARTLAFGAALLCVFGSAAAAQAQHSGDIGIGRSGAGQLMIRPFDPNISPPSFDVETGVGTLTYFAASNSWRDDDPGFDANFAASPDDDYFKLASGASIRLVAIEDLEPAFRVVYQAQTVTLAGQFITLGSATLHRHAIFIVDGNNAAFDPIRTLWFGRFVLRDIGSTGYDDSAPFTIRMRIVDCIPGDVNDDGDVTFADIDPFVAVLSNPAGSSVDARCAGDVNLDGYVTFGDIDPFVAALGR